MNKLGFRKALITALSIVLLLSLSITIMLSNQILKSTASEDLKRTILNSATYESYRIAGNVAKSASTVTGLASLYEKYSVHIAPQDLMKISQVAGSVHKVTAGFEDGSSYASKHDINFPLGVGDLSRYDPRTRPWFMLGRASSGLKLSDVFFTTRGNQPMLGAVHPIEKGTLLVDIRLNHLHKLLEEMKVVDGAVGVITDGDGMVLASTAKYAEIRDKLQELPETSKIAAQVFANQHTFNTIWVDGKESVLVSKKIELVTDETWYLMISVDTDTAFATVQAATWKLNSLALVVAVISILVLLLVLNKLYQPVLELKATVRKLADGEGDLTSRIEVKSKDDLGAIAKGINTFIESLQSMMLEVKAMTSKLSTGVDVLREQEHQSSEILTNHLSETDQVVTAMEELSCSAKVVSDHAEHTVEYTNEANNVAEQSKGTIVSAQQSLTTLSNEVEEATDNVTKMSAETQSISSILSVIGGIAEQTNLLALNAAIEAARAGEQGRGFAVVADEVRALASKTQQSTHEIEAALGLLQDGANTVVTSIERTGNTSQNAVSEAQAIASNLGDMTDFVSQINDLSVQISTSAHEQNTVIQELNSNMARIHSMVDELSTKGKNIQQETGNIEYINSQLSEIVAKFKLQ